MERILLGDALDLIINFSMLSINVIMLLIMFGTNSYFASVSLWEISINRGLLIGNVVLALLSFYWIYRKRIKLEHIIEEIKKKHVTIK